MIEINNRMVTTITLIHFNFSNILCMHVVITSLLNTEAKPDSCYIFKMKRICNYFHTNKTRNEDRESSETVAPDRSSVDFVILDEAPTVEKREVFRNHSCKYKN